MTRPVFDEEKHEAQRAVGQFMNHASICWCGAPEDFLRLLLAELERFDEEGRSREALPCRDPLRLTFAVVMDSWGLTDHGSSMSWAWLSPSGVRLRDALRKLDLGGVDRGSVDLDELLPSRPDGWYAREAEHHPRTRDGVKYVDVGEWETGL